MKLLSLFFGAFLVLREHDGVSGFHVLPPTEVFQSLPSVLDHLSASSSLTISSLVEDVGGGLLARYHEALQTDALRTQVATGVGLAVLGDAIAQKAGGSNTYDTKRAVSFATFDACYRAVQHYLYPPMIAICHGSVLGSLIPSQTIAAALEQSLVSQLLIIPTLYYPTFYAITGFVQGLTLEETVNRAKTAFWPLMRRNWAFWIPVQAIVFGAVHDEAQQISILIAAGLIWTIILSSSAGQATPTVKENVLVTSQEAEVADILPETEMQRFAFQTAGGSSLQDASANSAIMPRSEQREQQPQLLASSFNRTAFE